MPIDEVTEILLGLVCLWFFAHVVLNVYRFVRHAASNLIRGRRVGDWLFEPVEFDQLSAKTLAHFERFTPEMRELGFEPIRDYRLRRYPGSVIARYFLSPDGKTVGEISDYLGQRAYSFFTVFDDGTYLETSACRSAYSPPESRLLVINVHSDASVAELYARHLEHVCVHAGYTHCCARALQLTPSELDEAANYGRRLVHAHVLWRSRPVQPPDFIRCLTQSA
jgi:hypothetical protein